MTHTIVIAGLSVPAFDRIRKESESRIAPGGRLVVAPNHDNKRYALRHAEDLLAKAHQIAAKLDENKKFTTLLLYADFGDETTEQLLEKFFPFCLPLAFQPFEAPENASRRVLNEHLNKFAERILSSSRSLRARSREITDFTSVANLTPLLLPVRNFKSKALIKLLRHLYRNLAVTNEPRDLVDNAVRAFFAECPRTRAPGQERHCFSDGHYYFQSPGKARHGYFRNGNSGNHNRTCLLNARSRVGGSYDYKLHYDCIPTKGKLKATYDNCHGAPTAPKSTHVNIAPNDYIV